MPHQVTCQYCKQSFDRDKIAAKQLSGGRWMHEECYEKFWNGMTPAEQAQYKENEEYCKLEDYICKLFNIQHLTAKIRKQIKDIRSQYRYSYSGMLKTLKWWYEIQNHSIEEANAGIGIIPYVYDRAYDYYYSLFLAEQANKEIEEYNPNIIVIKIQSPQSQPHKRKEFKI